MIAASATACSPSVIRRSSGSSVARVPSSVRSVSPVARAAHDDPATRELRAVEGVERAAPDVHDVVRHVDDVRDRAHAGEVQRDAQPLRRRADRDVAEDPADVAGAAARSPRPTSTSTYSGADRGSSGSGRWSSPPQSAATSRASPTIDSRSTRLMVGVTSSTWSCSGSTSRAACPARARPAAP